MATQERIQIEPRQVTDAEVAHFEDKGWTKLPGLISREAATDLLHRAQERMGEAAEAAFAPEKSFNRQTEQFRTYYKIDEEDEQFRALRLHPQMGANAARLYGRDMAVRVGMTLVAPKLPSKLAGTLDGTGKTEYHQDLNVPIHSNTIGFWIALDEVTPEMGSMRFREGAHKLGWLAPPVDDWPQVEELPLSPPLTLQPGDATAHHQYMIHGAPENTTDRTRWGFIFSFFPAHARYLGTPSHHTDGLGLEIGQPLDHPNWPVVYDPGT
jgi:ectoine hydroxylase-related dioxygenase (phytanoyl-CoA dioxygenase family)